MHNIQIQGKIDPAFAPVKDVMENWLHQDREYGGAVSLVLAGKTVIDLWGGFQDKERHQEWQEDTVVCMMSVAKGFGALCVLLLADRGLLNLEDPVAKYWPEFGQKGKGKILVRHAISQLAGMPYVDNAPDDSAMDHDVIFAAMAEQTPVWPAGETPAYHSFLHGYFCAALVQKVTGQSIADFWRAEIAGPMGADFFFACPPEVVSRKADLYFDEDDPFLAFVSDLENPFGRSWRPFPKSIHDLNQASEWYSWGIPSIGYGNARAVARIMGALANGGEAYGHHLLSPPTVEAIETVQWDTAEAMFGIPMRNGLGFILSNDTFPLTGGKRVYCTIGQGGAMGIADPDLKLGMGFSPNHGSQVMGENPYLTELLKAACDCL